MVTGELGFEDLFGLGTQPNDYIPGEYHVSNFIMWIIFLVLLPIILNNMLVSYYIAYEIRRRVFPKEYDTQNILGGNHC